MATTTKETRSRRTATARIFRRCSRKLATILSSREILLICDQRETEHMNALYREKCRARGFGAFRCLIRQTGPWLFFNKTSGKISKPARGAAIFSACRIRFAPSPEIRCRRLNSCEHFSRACEEFSRFLLGTWKPQLNRAGTSSSESKLHFAIIQQENADQRDTYRPQPREPSARAIFHGKAKLQPTRPARHNRENRQRDVTELG